ncbi:hypothetical protein D3C73_1278120 [compost metagenome]
MHGDFGLLELVLGSLHFHRSEFGTTGADGVVDRGLGDGELLAGWVTGATGQYQAAADRQCRHFQAVQGRKCASSGFHRFQLHGANS